jgi:hypothetical protein
LKMNIKCLGWTVVYGKPEYFEQMSSPD